MSGLAGFIALMSWEMGFEPVAGILRNMLAGVFLLSSTFLFIAVANVYVFRRRKSFVFPEAFPFNTTYEAGYRRYHDFLDYILESFQRVDRERGEKTFAVHALFLPTFVFTNSVENITHILKDNFDNYVKGPAMKFRFTPLLGDGIFNSDGESWRWHRKTSAYLFNVSAFRSTVLTTFNKHASHVIRILQEQNDVTLDLHALMHSFTLDSIGEIAFGMRIGSLDTHARRSSPHELQASPGVDFEKSFDYLQSFAAETYTNPFWPFKRLFTSHLWRFSQHVRTVDRYAYAAVAQCRAEMQQRKDASAIPSQKQRADLLSLYFAHKIAPVDGNNDEDEDENGKKKKNRQPEPSDKVLRDILLNFVIAGRDTTAQALSWALLELSRHQHVQQRARDEVFAEWKGAALARQQQLPSCDGPGPDFGSSDPDPEADPEAVSYEALGRMRYLDAVCHETLRLYPSVPKEAKYAVKDDVLPDGYRVHKGDSVCFFPWVMGRTEALWGADCLDFRPERFFEMTTKPSPFVFSAFQAGPRTCLGQNLALLEMKCALARLLAVFKFAPLPGLASPQDKISYGISLTLPMDKALRLQVDHC